MEIFFTIVLSFSSPALSLATRKTDHSERENSSEEDLSYNLKTNLYGVVNTINAFLPLLKENQQGKKQIFVTSSTLGSIGGPYGKMPVASACTFFRISSSFDKKE